MKKTKFEYIEPAYTTWDIGQLMGTDPSSVHKWIDRGLLKGYRTPGGHRRVRRGALRAFLLAHGMTLPEELRGQDDFRLLIVDDNPEVLSSLSRGIARKRPGWAVETSRDGYEALLRIPRFEPNAMVLDILLPRMDGVAVLRALKHDSPSLRTVAISGKADHDLVKKVTEAGASAFMRKPISPAGLVETIDRACGRLARFEQARA